MLVPIFSISYLFSRISICFYLFPFIFHFKGKNVIYDVNTNNSTHKDEQMLAQTQSTTSYCTLFYLRKTKKSLFFPYKIYVNPTNEIKYMWIQSRHLFLCVFFVFCVCVFFFCEIFFIFLNFYEICQQPTMPIISPNCTPNLVILVYISFFCHILHKYRK